jgi:hypothetical protein
MSVLVTSEVILEVWALEEIGTLEEIGEYKMAKRVIFLSFYELSRKSRARNMRRLQWVPFSAIAE